MANNNKHTQRSPYKQPKNLTDEKKGNQASDGGATENLPAKKDEHILVQHGFVPNPEGNPRTENKKLAFLDYYNDFLTPAHTCQAIRISLATFYDWLKADPQFKNAYNVVDRFLTDRYVRMAGARAFRGSDNLLMFMLKARDPRFRERVQTEFDPKEIESLVSQIVTALRQTIPNACPHCKSNLHLTSKVEQMLQNLSKGVKT